MTVKRVEVTRYDCKCDRKQCGHRWQTKTDRLPKVCPVCKQPNWDKPKKEGKK